MKTEQVVKTNSGFLIAGLMVLTLIGFYRTYISKFPYFEGVTTIHHFHGAMMMVWFVMLGRQRRRFVRVSVNDLRFGHGPSVPAGSAVLRMTN